MNFFERWWIFSVAERTADAAERMADAAERTPQETQRKADVAKRTADVEKQATKAPLAMLGEHPTRS